MSYSAESKGTGPKNAKYAHGGKCFSSRSIFMKVPDSFREDTEKTDYDKKGKGGTLSKMIEKKA
jgi:hypothetical protein